MTTSTPRVTAPNMAPRKVDVAASVAKHFALSLSLCIYIYTPDSNANRHDHNHNSNENNHQAPP